MSFVGSIARGLAPQVQRSSGDAADISGQGGPSGTWIPAFGGNVSATGLRVNQATAMAVSAVYGCVTIRSEDGARCTPRLFSVDPKTNARTQVAAHPVAELFASPNPVQTWFEFYQQMTAARLLRGNAFAVKLPKSNGDTSALIPVNPDQVVMLEAPDGSLFYSVSRLGLWQIATLKGMPPAVPAEFMFHLRGLSLNVLLGISPLALARDAIGLAQAQERQAARWMQNGARPSGVLKTPNKLTKEAAERLRERWEAYRAGLDNTGSTAVLEEGMEYQQLQLDSAQLQFIAARQLQMEEIARFYRIPPRKLGRADSSGRGTSVTQQDQEYVNEAIMPDLENWEQRIVKDFDLRKEGLIVDFDEDALLRADALTRYNIYRIAVLTGLAPPNECRRAEGLKPLPGGDDLLRPVNMAPEGSAIDNEPADNGGTHGGGKLPQPVGENPEPATADDSVGTGA